MVEAFPEDSAPRFLIRDRDQIYVEEFCQRVKGMPRAEQTPNLGAVVEIAEVGGLAPVRVSGSLMKSLKMQSRRTFGEPQSFSLFGRSPAKKAKDLLIRLAEDSGGRAFFPTDVRETPAIAAQIVKDLRAQYVISYYPSKDRHDGFFRSVRVVVDH